LESTQDELAEKSRELDEVSEELISTRDTVSDLLAAHDTLKDERQAAQKEVKQLRDLNKVKEDQLKAVNQRIREMETSASLVVPTATVTAQQTESSNPTETPFLVMRGGSGIDEISRGANTSPESPPMSRRTTVPTGQTQRLGASISTTSRVSMSNLPPGDQNSIAVAAMAQNMINGTPVALAGAHSTPAQVKKYVENVNVQLRTNTFFAASMDFLVDEAAWRTISIKIANSRTFKNNLARDWRKEWSTATWLETLEEVYAIDDTS